jgi:hypothetical protein
MHIISDFFAKGTNQLNNQAVAIKFEPRKSEAPQLRDEYRTYKALHDQCEENKSSGAGTCKLVLIDLFPLQMEFRQPIILVRRACIIY